MEVAIGCGITFAVVASFTRSLASDFIFLALSTVLFGLGFAICFPNLPKMVKENFPQRLAGTATGLYTTAIPLGAGLGIALTKPLLVATGGWQHVLMVWSLIVIPVAVLWWVVALLSLSTKATSVTGCLESQFDKAPLNHYFTKRSFSPVLISGLLLFLLNLVFYCMIGWLPTYLSEKGWDPTAAATATSLISFTEIPGILLFPVLSNRIGRRRMFIFFSFFLIAVCSAIVAFRPSLSWFLSPIFGITFGGTFALLLALPVEIVEGDKVGRAAGAILSIGYLGALLGPPLTGLLRDMTGAFGLGFLILTFAGFVAAGLTYGLPEQRLSRDR
jgi:CP family cyanate transporter-like MFS transporter